MKSIKRDIVAVLVYSKDHKLLMGKKDPKGGGVYPDCWHIPGGGVEEGETQEEAAMREVKEEVGIDITSYKIEFITDEDTAEKSLKTTGVRVMVEMQFYVYTVIISNKNSNEINLIFSDDLVEGKWFDTAELSTVKLTPPSEKYFRKIGYIK